MSNNGKSNEQELQKLREILFGEQALQTDERLSGIEAAINGLRRENRQVRHALEVEAVSRVEADRAQFEQLDHDRRSGFQSLSGALLNHLQQEREQRLVGMQLLVEVMQTQQRQQDEVVERLVAEIKREQQRRHEELKQLLENVRQNQARQDEVSADFMTILTQFQHDQTESAASHENSSADGPR